MITSEAKCITAELSFYYVVKEIDSSVSPYIQLAFIKLLLWARC